MYEGILAGIDGSPCGMDAAMWAAHTARLRGLRLQLVHVVDPLRPAAPPQESLGAALYRDEHELLEEAVLRIGEAFPEVKAWSLLLHGPPTEVLVREADRVGFVVLGRHGAGGATGPPGASTAYAVAGHVRCPVVVVPAGRLRAHGPVIVGVDGSDHAAHALRFAFEEARTRRCALRLVQVHHGRDAAAATPDVRMSDHVRRLSAAVLASGHMGRPEVNVTEEAYRGDPAEVLGALGRDAELLVVGSRGLGSRRDALRERMFGSVSQTVLHRADCPLAVVRR